MLVRTESKNQKFLIGQRVIVSGKSRHSTGSYVGKEAVVLYTDAYIGGEDEKSYCLRFSDGKDVSWFDESELTSI